VQCRSIPTDYPTAAVETLLDRFLERSSVDGLLVVYYRGYGGLDREGRMLFSRYALSLPGLFLVQVALDMEVVLTTIKWPRARCERLLLGRRARPCDAGARGRAAGV
jgi:hypothetical protein